MPPPRTILHLDLDTFFCAVEELANPSLTGKAFAVGGRPDERGVVASCSYPARVAGVRSAMPMGRALRLCPGLIVVPGRHQRYSEVSRQVMARLHDLTPLVEQISIDEAFLDVSDLPEPGEILARRLQARIRSELSLPCSLGVAANKLVAKIASDTGKRQALHDPARQGQPPNAITIVPPGEEAAFLAPLPVEALWGVGPKTAETLAALGVHTIGDLAALPEAALIQRFGKNGYDLARRACGLDDRPVVVEHETKSISQEITFTHDLAAGEELRRVLRHLAEGVGRQLRQEGLSGKTVKLKLRWPDFTTLSRQQTLAQPTDQDGAIEAAALALFAAVWQPDRAVRLLGVGVAGLSQSYRQLSLWDAQQEEDRRLQAALDHLRARYGRDIVQRGDQEAGRPVDQ